MRPPLVLPGGIRTVPDRAGEPTAARPGEPKLGATGFLSTNAQPRRAKKRKVTAKATPALLKVTPARVMTLRTRPVSVVPLETTGSLPPPPRSPRLPREEEPYGPVGVRVGSFLIRPSIEVSEGYDNNPTHVQGGPGSRFTVVAPSVALRSDWSRHELSAEIRGSYTSYSDVSDINRPEASALVRGRIDVSSMSRIELEGRARLWTEYPGSPDAISSAVRPPNVYSFGGSAGFVQRFNRFELGIYGGIDRSIYDDALLTTGSIFDLSWRDYNTYSTRLRGTYEFTTSFKPFVETVIDRRVYDQEIDPTGIHRGSNGVTVRAGALFDRKDILTGEISAGFTWRSYHDPTLPDIAGLVFNSSLIWRATPLTTVTLNGTSTVDETIVTGASGLFRREGRVVVDHALRRWLIASASLSYGHEDYVGGGRLDQRTRVGAALTYYLNRYMALRGEMRREWLTSNVPGVDYTSNIMLVGLRLQR